MAVLVGPGTTKVVLEGHTVVYEGTVVVTTVMPVEVTGTPGVKVAVLVSVHGHSVIVRVSDAVAV